jgi:hypothetical protein
MSTTLTEHELSVPGRFVALFRLALIDEVKFDAKWIKEQSAEVSEFYEAADPPDPYNAVEGDPKTLEVRLADLRGPIRALADDYNMFERIARHTPWPGPAQDLTIQGSHATLHGALEATIRRAAKDLVCQGTYSPIDGGRIVNCSSAAIWAAEELEHLNTVTGEAAPDDLEGDA